MASPREFEYEKLTVGLLYTNEDLLSSVMKELTNEFGPVDLVSESYCFSAEFSDYYDAEMGGTAQRRFVSFEKCVDPQRLAQIKLLTNAIEARHALEGKRRINIDPGLIGPGKYVMATTKNAGFRIPLSDGIYAELSLIYSRKEWVGFHWTYCDVKSALVREFLTKVRSVYLRQRREFK